MVLFLLRSAGSPWNLLRCGRRWTTSSSADCACQMQLPKAFVFRQLIFGINANPHYKSFRSLMFATRCGRVEASLRSVVRAMPVIGRRRFFWLLSALVLSGSRSIPRREASALSGMDTSAVGPMPRKPSSTALSLRRAQSWISEAGRASQASKQPQRSDWRQRAAFASISPATRHS
jgi:hypothetical protein